MDNSKPMREAAAEAQPSSFDILDIDIAADDSLAEAGYKALRQRYIHAGGRDAWALTSLSDAAPAHIAQLNATMRRLRSDGRLFESGFRQKAIRPVLRHIRHLATQLSQAHESHQQRLRLADYVERCDEEARIGLESLIQAWQSQTDELLVKLIASLNDDAHQDWLDSMDAIARGDGIADAERPIEPGESAYVRHVMRAVIETRLRSVRAFDTLPDVPSPNQMIALRHAIERLAYVVESLVSAKPFDGARDLLAACHAAVDAYSPVCEAYAAASSAYHFATKQRVAASGARSFADAQTKVAEARLGDWRGLLRPLL